MFNITGRYTTQNFRIPHYVALASLTSMKLVMSQCEHYSLKMVKVNMSNIYEDESIIIRKAGAFVFLLAALSFSRASLGVVFFLSQLCRFEVARSVPLPQP